ncbi:phage tail tape measure protein, partial [Vibrio anguillarum]
GAGKVDYEALVKNQEKQLKTLISQRDELSTKVQTQEEEASKQAEFNKLQQEAIKASEAINKVRMDGLSTDEKRNKAVKEYLANVEKIRLANPESALLNPEQIKKDIKAIEESFKESNKAISDSASQQMIMRLREQEATLSKQLENNAKLGAAQQELVKFEQQIADLKEKKTLTAQQKSLIADQELIREQLNKNVAIEQELSLRDQAIRIQNMQASVTAQLSSDIERYQSSLANFGAGDETLKRLKEEQAIRNDINKQLERATSRNLAGKTSNEELEAEKRMLEQSLQDRLSAQGQYYEQLDKLESDWKNGAKAAFDNYIYEASRAAKISEGLFNSAFSAMEDAILQFALTGKASFKDFAAAVVKDIARIASQQAAAGLLSYGVSLFASAYAGSSSGASTGLNNGFGQNAYDNISFGSGSFSSGGYTGSGGKNQPAGIVHRGEVVWSQDDIAKAGGVGVVEAMRKGLLNYKEGLKGYANGGVVGLNAPAISSMSSNQNVIIQQQINIPESQNASGGTADDQMIAKAYAESAKAGAKDQIAKELMPGGLIWRAQNGR